MQLAQLTIGSPAYLAIAPPIPSRALVTVVPVKWLQDNAQSRLLQRDSRAPGGPGHEQFFLDANDDIQRLQ